ncbi:MAG: hypothetical protein IJC48_07345 [Clostridia bacterium]|nr:hypothetical protein [Clostridia bacterium]
MKKIIALLLTVMLAFSAAAIAEENPVYRLGDAAADFEMNVLGETNITMSEIINKSGALLVVFIETIDERIKEELSLLQMACEELAADPLVSVLFTGGQTQEELSVLKKELSLNLLLMGSDDNRLFERFEWTDQALPLYVLIDRYGVICCLDNNFSADESAPVSLLTQYLKSDYSESLLTDEMPKANEIQKAPVIDARNGRIAQFPIGPEKTPDSNAVGKTYAVRYRDENGNPVTGVMTQMCSDRVCMVFFSDGDGLVSYTGDEYAYEVHVLMPPDGFQAVIEAFVFPSEGGEIEIVMKAK